MVARVACLSPYDEGTVRAMFKDLPWARYALLAPTVSIGGLEWTRLAPNVSFPPREGRARRPTASAPPTLPAQPESRGQHPDESDQRSGHDLSHVEVVLVPPPLAQPAVKAACAAADRVIADRRHKHRIDREVLQQMPRCKLIQQAAAGFDSIDHRAVAESGIPVANAARYNKDWHRPAAGSCSQTPRSALSAARHRSTSTPRSRRATSSASTLAVLRSGHVAGAGLDVFEVEPCLAIRRHAASTT
jgi:D-isomer specific 2-hydroxyacid dehydrogenase, catalytic domain